MHSCNVNRLSSLLGILLLSTLVLGCEDKRIKELNSGMSRDSVLSVLSGDAKGSGADSLPNIYKRSRYLMAGREYEVLYFTPKNAKPGKDSVPMKDLTPVVLAENRLIGRGWAFWDSVSTANKRPVDKRD